MVIARDRRSGVSRSILGGFTLRPERAPPEPNAHLMGPQIAALLKLITPDAMPSSCPNIHSFGCEGSPSGKPDWGSGLCDLGSGLCDLGCATLGIRQP